MLMLLHQEAISKCTQQFQIRKKSTVIRFNKTEKSCVDGQIWNNVQLIKSRLIKLFHWWGKNENTLAVNGNNIFKRQRDKRK